MLYVVMLPREYLVILGAKELMHYMADYNLSISGYHNSSSKSQSLFTFDQFTSIYDEVLLLSVEEVFTSLGIQSTMSFCLLLSHQNVLV